MTTTTMTMTMTMTMTRPTARASIIAGLVVMLAALTACGGSDDANPDTTEAPAAPSADADAGEATGGTDADAGEGAGAIEAEAEAEGGETTGGTEAEGGGEGDGAGDADAEQPSVASEARPVVAAVPVEIDEASLDIELHPIEVTGEVMTVNVTVRNTSADPTAGRWAVGTSFADGVNDPQAGPGPLVVDARSVDGIHVVDTVNATRHLVARDDRGYCVCSSTEALWLESGDSVVFSATFAAPPADIDQVDVFVPLAGTFTEVSIQRR